MAETNTKRLQEIANRTLIKVREKVKALDLSDDIKEELFSILNAAAFGVAAHVLMAEFAEVEDEMLEFLNA